MSETTSSPTGGPVDSFNSSISSWLEDTHSQLQDLKMKAMAVSGGGYDGKLRQAGQNIIDSAQADADVKKKSDDDFVMAQMGVTPGAPSDAIVSARAALVKSLGDSAAQSQKIQAMQDTSFFDDPLTWVTNQIAIPFEQDTLNTINSRQAQIEKTLNSIAKQTDDQTRWDNIVDVADAREVQAGKAKINADMAAKAAAESANAAANISLNKYNIASRLTQEEFTNVLSADANRRANVQQDLSIKADARAEAMAPLQEVYKQEAILRLSGQVEDKDRKRSAEASFVSRANESLQVLGYSPLDSYDSYLKMDPTKRKIIEGMADNPERANGSLGATPADALANLKNMRTIPNPAVADTGNRLQTVVDSALTLRNANPTNKPFKSLAPDEQRAFINKAISDAASHESANVPITGGMFSLPSMDKTLSAVDDTQLGRMLRPLADKQAADGQALATDPKILSAEALRMISDPNNNYSVANAADEIKRIYQLNIVNMNGLKAFDKFKMGNYPTPGDPNSKYIQIVPGPFGQNVAVDWTDSSSIANYLTRMQVYKTRNLSGSGVPYDPLAEQNAQLRKGITR